LAIRRFPQREAAIVRLRRPCGSGAIGRRYRRQDEIGTPYGITIDFETIEKGAGVTVRDRDTLEQVRMTEDEVVRFLDDKVNG